MFGIFLPTAAASHRVHVGARESDERLTPNVLRERLRDAMFSQFLSVYCIVLALYAGHPRWLAAWSTALWAGVRLAQNLAVLWMWRRGASRTLAVSVWGWCCTSVTVYVAWGVGRQHAMVAWLVWSTGATYPVLVALLGLRAQAWAMLMVAIAGVLMSETVVAPFLPLDFLIRSLWALPAIVGTGTLALVTMYLQISERVHERLESTFAEAARLKDHLLATVSHEMRTPLHGIIASLELLDGASVDASEQRLLLQNVQHCASVLHLLINNVLLSGGGGSQSSHVAARVVLGALARRVEAVAKALALRREALQLSVLVPSQQQQHEFTLPDELGVTQVVLNFASNAIRCAASHVHIALSLHGSELVARVEDDGPGVPPEQRPHLFLGKPRQAGLKGSGAGLGLGICQRIAGSMGGRVWYEEGAGGKGAVFCMSVPVAMAGFEQPQPLAMLMRQPSLELYPPSPLAASKFKKAPPQPHQQTFLVVDDNELNQAVLERYLARLSLPAPVTLSSGIGAIQWLLDRIQHHRHVGPVTVLLDLAMPLLDGQAVVRLWRQIEADVQEPLEPARIIIVSATHLPNRPPGVDAVLQKPLRLEPLQRLLLGKGNSGEGG